MPRPPRPAPPCLRPADGQRAVLQPVPETAGPQRKAIFDPVDVRRRVSVDHTVQADAAPHRLHQVGEGFPLQDRSLCTMGHETEGQRGGPSGSASPHPVPKDLSPDPRRAEFSPHIRDRKQLHVMGHVKQTGGGCQELCWERSEAEWEQGGD